MEHLNCVKPMSQDDIDLLAVMCNFCAPIIVKGWLLKRAYAYYVPIYESDFGVVKKIFAKSGIKMHEHYSRIISSTGSNVLRANYASHDDEGLLLNIMRQIDCKRLMLFNGCFNKQRAELNQKLAAFRANQK